MTVDGTDFRINEPTPFWPGWKSFKFNGPGVRYEVAVCIRSGDLVWINGPFPCGQWPDLKIFREALIYELRDGENVEADKGYQGEPDYIKAPNSNIFLNAIGKRQKALARTRHETINKRFKQFHCLSRTFRHRLSTHGAVFRAVAVMTQISIESGEPLFGVAYDDRMHFL